MVYRLPAHGAVSDPNPWHCFSCIHCPKYTGDSGGGAAAALVVRCVHFPLFLPWPSRLTCVSWMVERRWRFEPGGGTSTWGPGSGYGQKWGWLAFFAYPREFANRFEKCVVNGYEKMMENLQDGTSVD